MLSRTAAQLYWMSRYLERAENLARMLDVSYSLSLLPQSRGAAAEIGAPLVITGSWQAFHQKHAGLTADRLVDFMVLDLDNPSSIVSCLRCARENAHAVRGKITAEMWENINATWLEAQALPRSDLADAGACFDWVKERSHLFRGATYGTLQRNDAYWFIRLGTFIERADNTARILDVKAHLIGPGVAESAPDYYAWSALLRSLSAFEAYHEAYRDTLSARRVAELLILRRDIPRSLRACCDEILQILPQIESGEGAADRGRPVKRMATSLAASLQYGAIDEILVEGLHRYLSHFLGEVSRLADSIHHAYLEAA